MERRSPRPGLFSKRLEDLVDESKGEKVPRFVLNASEYIIRHALAEEGIFRVCASQRDMVILRGVLDETGQDFDFESARPDYHSACGLLKTFFREPELTASSSERDCLMTSAMYRQWLALADVISAREEEEKRLHRAAAAAAAAAATATTPAAPLPSSASSLAADLIAASIRSLVDRLPEVNKATLTCVMLLLRQVSANSERNLMLPKGLGVIWGPTLLWPRRKDSSDEQQPVAPPDGRVQKLMETAQAAVIVREMIEKYEAIFEEPPLAAGNPMATLSYCLVVSEKPTIATAVMSQGAGSGSYNVWVTDNVGTAHIFDSETVVKMASMETGQGSVYSAQTIGTMIWISSQTSLCIWDTDKGGPKVTVHGFHYTIAEVGSTIWTGGAGKIQIWEFDGQEVDCVMELMQQENVVMAIEWTGGSVWTGGTDQTIRIYSQRGVPVTTLSSLHKRIFCFRTVCGFVWSGHEDGTICVWDLTSKSCVAEIKTPGDADSVHKLVAVGNFVLSCHRSGTVHVWSGQSRKLVWTLPTYHTDAVVSALPLWNKARRRWQLWMCSWDGSITTWNLNQTLFELKPPTRTVQLSGSSGPSSQPVHRRKPSILQRDVLPDQEKIVKAAVSSPKSSRKLHRLSRMPSSAEAMADSTVTVECTTPICSLVTGAMRHTRVYSAKEAITKLFADANIWICGDLLGGRWEQLRASNPSLEPRVARAVSSVVSQMTCKHPEGYHIAPATSPKTPPRESATPPSPQIRARPVHAATSSTSSTGSTSSSSSSTSTPVSTSPAPSPIGRARSAVMERPAKKVTVVKAAAVAAAAAPTLRNSSTSAPATSASPPKGRSHSELPTPSDDIAILATPPQDDTPIRTPRARSATIDQGTLSSPIVSNPATDHGHSGHTRSRHGGSPGHRISSIFKIVFK